MDTERNLLFGIVAFQHGAVAADGLAETCADWVTEPTRPLAERMVERGWITAEQRTELESAVAQELAAAGGDPRAALASTLDGRSLEALGPLARTGLALAALPVAPPPPAPACGRGPGPIMLGALAPGEAAAARERYTLTHLHAKGGMGRVWLARDAALGRQIALKELRPDQADNTTVCSRFLYEARITAQLEHPGIVPVYELGQGGTPYYTMRFVRGRTLGEAIRAYHKRRADGEPDRVGLVELLTAYVGVCQAVGYAHARGIIHRDLKGQNVVLGDYGEVIVLDWGLAKRVGPDPATGEGSGAAPAADAATDPNCATDRFTLPMSPDASTCDAGGPDETTLPAAPEAETVAASDPGRRPGQDPGSNGRRPTPESGAGPEGTMQGQLLGTPAYMAPEQARGRHDLVDRRTDIYGLGAILYEILTGRPPFVAPRTSAIIHKVCQEAPTPPRQVVATVAPALEAICLKALQKEPSDRYATATELAQEVRRWLADEPVRAYPEPWTRRAARWARRHKPAVAAAAGLLVAATLALGVGAVLIGRERDEAEAQGRQARQAVHLLTKIADIGFDERLDPLQKEFLEQALAYYEQFTGRAAGDASVRLEHGRAYQQMGDIRRKLGRLADAERSYRRAAEMLEPLATGTGAGTAREARRALARTHCLLGDLLVRRGADPAWAEALYRRAVETQRLLADAAKDPAATAEDRLRLGQTLKSQADLLRLCGRFSQAMPVYDQAIAELERARAADAQGAEIRNELALALDARGLIRRDLGELQPAGQDLRRALELLDKLVAEFPTVPRHREALAKVCNSLGLLEQDAGHLADAAIHLRRELPLVERLAQDFPDRPEHRRELARTLYNLGTVLLGQDRVAEAETAFRRAVEVIGAIAARHADDVQIRLDLAKSHRNLGELLLEKGDARQAIPSLLQARAISEALVQTSPDQPRYRSLLAGTLASLGFALQAVGQAQVEESYRAALAIYEKLVADHPDNVEYRVGQARCLRNLGPIEAGAGRPEQAEAMYRRALALLDTQDAAGPSPERLRDQGEVLNNLGDLQRELGRPEAEQSLRRALETFASLAARRPADRKDRHRLAIAQYNLGETLASLKRPTEAATLFDRARAGFETLAAEVPKSVDFQSQLGLVLNRRADLLADAGRLKEARAALEAAVAHQRQAVQLSRNRNDTRALLGAHLIALAAVDLKLGAYREAAAYALEVPNAVPAPDRGEGCLDAARLLARLIARLGGDAQLPQAERDQLTRHYLGRTIVFLRETIDASPKLADRVKNDPDIKALEARPEFQAIMNTLVNVGR